MKKLVILGGKESGYGAAVLGKKEGWEVFVSDKGTLSTEWKDRFSKLGVEVEEGNHSMDKILAADLVVKSPGIYEKYAVMQAVRAAQVPVISEVEFAFRYSKAKFIAITGTNGKTTTTALTYHLLQRAGLDVGLGGNIGNSIAFEVAMQDREYFVVEVSNFQLDDIVTFKPWIAILTNITPDHLDAYDYQFERYIYSKFRITANQDSGDHFIYCAEDPVTMQHMGNYTIHAQKKPFSIAPLPGSVAWYAHPNFHIHMERDQFIHDYESMPLRGRHNLYNTMAAAIVARLMEVRKDSLREALSDFQNVEHRMEPVANVGGIEFINDSKATNVNSAWFALESLNKPVVWIAGGVDKGNDYSILVPLVEKKVKTIIALGTEVKKIHESFGKKVPMIINATNMEEAVKLSYHMADKGDIVLLSPACASFDLFENYEDRGRQFKKHVREL